MSIFNDDLGSSIPSLSLTLNPAFSGKPCRRSRLKRSGSGEPVNGYKYKIQPDGEWGQANYTFDMIHRINNSIKGHIEWDLYDFVSFFWEGN